MGVLSSDDRERVRARLSELSSPVTLVHFTQDTSWPCTGRARTLLEELTAESRHVHLRLVDFAADPETAERFGVTQVPATVITAGGKVGLRFDGAPEGAELEPFLDSIAAVSGGAAEDRLAVLASPPTREVIPV